MESHQVQICKMWCSSREYTWDITILWYVNDTPVSGWLYADDNAILFANKDPVVISHKIV